MAKNIATTWNAKTDGLECRRLCVRIRITSCHHTQTHTDMCVSHIEAAGCWHTIINMTWAPFQEWTQQQAGNEEALTRTSHVKTCAKTSVTTPDPNSKTDGKSNTNLVWIFQRRKIQHESRLDFPSTTENPTRILSGFSINDGKSNTNLVWIFHQRRKIQHGSRLDFPSWMENPTRISSGFSCTHNPTVTKPLRPLTVVLQTVCQRNKIWKTRLVSNT